MPRTDHAQIDDLLARSRALVEQSEALLQQLAAALVEAEEYVTGTPSPAPQPGPADAVKPVPNGLPALSDHAGPWP
jgi:hypothetical protein